MTYQIPRSVTLQKFIPVTGATVTVQPSDSPVIGVMLNNVGLLATLTLQLPITGLPGQLIRVTFNGAITLLSYTGGTVLGGIAVAAANGYIAFIYDDTNSVWRRCA